MKGFICEDSLNSPNVTFEELKEKLNDDKKEVLNLVEDQNTLEKEIKIIEHKENLSKKLVANEKIKENVPKLGLDKTCIKSSNVIDCKDDILESTKEGDGHKYKLFIYNLPKHIVLNRYDVKSIFTEFGVVTDCKRNWTKKRIFHVTFEDKNVSKKLIGNGPIFVDCHKIKVIETSEDSKISAIFDEVGKTDIMDIFSKFGALKHYKYGNNKNKFGFYMVFEDERVNKMLIEEGSVDFYGHKILIKEVFLYTYHN